MSNAMKKLKLLHHLTAASANATSTSSIPPASAQQFPTPPTSPIRHHFHPQSQNYMDVSNALRSARQALNSMQSPVQHQQYHHQPEQFRPSHYNTIVQQPPRPSGAPVCLLPQAFMVLTPNDPHPAICLPASPPPVTSHMHNHYHHHSTLIPPVPINPPIQQVLLSEQAVPRGNTTIYSSRPPAPNVPSYPNNSNYQYQASRRPSSYKRPRLTTDAVSKIGKDSRLARWERVVGYVRQQRKASAESKDESLDTTPDHALSAIEASKAFIREIERKNKILDMVDYDEQEQRSLWSGGSAGTNGVDEFVWSEDDDDDNFRKIVENQNALDEHKRRLDRLYPEDVVKERAAAAAGEEGVFTLEDGEATVKDFDMDHCLTRSPRGSDKRPRSSPIPAETSNGSLNAYLEILRRAEVAKLPELRRESHLEGGLDRLAGREMRRFSVY